LNPNEIYQKLVEVGDAWVEARFKAEQLDRATKPLLSHLSSISGENSQAAKESWAYRHDDYRAHCEELALANLAEGRARIRYNAAETKVELMRTVSANERAANRSAT
jgi:hypothetical protein